MEEGEDNSLHISKETTSIKQILSSNYGRLLTRVQEAGFTNNIRAIMWYQGEANAANNQASFGFVKDYKPSLLQLINSWKEDYASVTNFYITQIRQGCVQPLDSTSVVQEAQRQTAVENSNYRIYGTGRLIHYMDGCHFPFANGYETLGKDWAAPLFEDLFGITAPANTTSPLVTNIQRINGNQVVLTMKTSDNLTVPANALPNFVFQGVSTQPVITNTSFAGNGLTLTLNAFPAGATGLTYAEANDNYVYNDKGLAMVHFFNQSISSLLPLRLVAFNAGFQNNTDVLLSWTTADESGIDSYKIQVSQDGSSFNTIGTITATNGSGNQSYSFVDKNAGTKNYYRLQIVEKAGSANYSSLKLVTKQVGKLSLLVSPNPTAINPMVSINSPVAQDAQIIINNANGQRVTIFKKQLIAGTNSFELNGSFLKTNGMYFVQLLTGDSFAQAKFIVAK
ncbi:MAG: sialate O-acetylesterase [Chitinophagaceae bacterium]